MVADSLRSKTLYALSWSFLESAGVQGVRFVLGIVLARLLFPEQFGLIGMLTIFIAVAQSFLDSGFGAALIRKRDPTPTDVCSIFYFNIVVGLVAAGILCLAAPWIAAFYNQPILTPLTWALSLTIVINSFGLIQSTILTKQIDFSTQNKTNMIASVLAGIIAVTLAATGFGVWSLVIQQISRTLLQTVFLWFVNAWRPALLFSLKSMREMFRFGSRLLVSGLLDQIFGNMYFLVIGKLFSATDLGFYTRAETFQAAASQSLSTIVGRVTFPVFSAIQDDLARLKRGLKRALTILVLVNFPIMIGLALIARPLVLVLLTDKWAECIPYLQLLCGVGLLFPLHPINLNVLIALGRSDLFLRLKIINMVMIVINIAITWRWGISAMIYGMIVNSFISYYLNSSYTGDLIGYPIREQLRDIFPYLVITALMGVVVYAAGLLPFAKQWTMLFVQITTGIIIYVCLCRIFRLTAFMELCQMIWNRISFWDTEVAGK
jgi:teichuronic acid exporter